MKMNQDDRRLPGQAGTYVYRCSRHPLVQSAHAGFCPQCGMAYEPVEVWMRPSRRDRAKGARIRLRVAAIVTALLAMVVVFPSQTLAIVPPNVLAWIELLLATLVCLGAAWPFHLRAIRAAGRGSFDMSTLASLGLLAPYGAGAIALLVPWTLPAPFRHDLPGLAFYFATASAAATLVLLGQVLEGRVRGEAAMARHGYLDHPSKPREPSGRFRRVLTDFFAPAVLVAAVGTVTIWGIAGLPARSSLGLVHGLALLLVACPCAFGLAAPLSLIFAIRRASSSGILFKDAESIEMLGRIDTLAMGKSGTLMRGRPDLSSVVAVSAFDEATVLRYAASLESGLRHPLANAIAQAAKDRGIRATTATEREQAFSRGVRGKVDGRAVSVGNLSMMVHHDPESGALGQTAETLRATGETVVYVSLDDHPIGLLCFHDHIRESAAEEIRILKADGVRIVLFSGDSRTTALAVAKRFDLDDALAEIPDGGMPAALASIQRDGRRVAMVGHGEVDAAVLEQAEIGIEIEGTFDPQRPGSRVALLDGDFGGLAKARAIARATHRNIQQNLFLAFGGSALGVVAASGVAEPLFGFSLSPEGAAVALFSLTALVAANAFRPHR